MKREEAIMIMHNERPHCGEKATFTEEERCDAYDMAIEALSAEAVQGEWIFRTDIPIGGGRESAGYVCSNCRKDYFHVDGMNFCPNCGADMRKEKE